MKGLRRTSARAMTDGDHVRHPGCARPRRAFAALPRRPTIFGPPAGLIHTPLLRTAWTSSARNTTSGASRQTMLTALTATH
jgi:hypothetical protein